MTSSLHTRELISGDSVVALRRRRLRLEIAAGPDKKLARDFDSDRILVGTHPSCDLALTDPTVSRQHCEVVLVRSGWAVRDLDSTNGVWLGHTRIADAVFDREAKLRLGDTTLRLLPTDATVDLPLAEEDRFGPLLGRSAAMRRVFHTLAKAAPTDLTVLLTGESGTGKEVAAQSIHEASRRSDGPFAVVDCAALPPTLIESALYGHERGAFTGADRARAGAFEAAQGGTLFLDEIGELPLDLQTRLLGAIERRQIMPLGTTRPRAIDARLVAATNRDLRREVARGAFREDLYFRLAVLTVELPPLRDRPEDIPLYIEAFLAEREEPFTIDPATIQRLSTMRWPGNVRELRHTLERAAALGTFDTPTAGDPPSPAADLRLALDPAVPYKTAKALLLEQFERAYVTAVLDRHAANITRAARAAEVDRVYFLRLLDKYGLRPRK